MWIKADDKLANHPKILRAGKLIGPDGAIIALGFFHWCLSYANEYLTDGFIADEIIEGCSRCRQPQKIAKALSECLVKAGGIGLFEKVDGGYQIHDYHDFNPTAEEAAELQEKKRYAGREGGIRSAEARKQKGKQTPSTCLGSASASVEADGQANGKQKSSSRARDPVPSRPSDPPNPPHEGGVNGNGTGRLTRAERKLAAKLGPSYSDDWYADCHHDPKCETGPMHRQRLGIDELKAEASNPNDEVTEKDLDAACRPGVGRNVAGNVNTCGAPGAIADAGRPELAAKSGPPGAHHALREHGRAGSAQVLDPLRG